mmetsp:Transcript_133517/g.426755  ORF Transcript_133517/g.426755 Transcript_133517/m.426755 type:complete len:285 (+) Transcript_133517:1523-2377(+)
MDVELLEEVAHVLDTALARHAAEPHHLAAKDMRVRLGGLVLLERLQEVLDGFHGVLDRVAVPRSQVVAVGLPLFLAIHSGALDSLDSVHEFFLGSLRGSYRQSGRGRLRVLRPLVPTGPEHLDVPATDLSFLLLIQASLSDLDARKGHIRVPAGLAAGQVAHGDLAPRHFVLRQVFHNVRAVATPRNTSEPQHLTEQIRLLHGPVKSLTGGVGLNEGSQGLLAVQFRVPIARAREVTVGLPLVLAVVVVLLDVLHALHELVLLRHLPAAAPRAFNVPGSHRTGA